MAPTDRDSNRKKRDQRINKYAKQGPKPSLRWDRAERRDWRSVDRELRGDTFDPRERDDRELRFYFKCGSRNPLRGLNPEQQKTWRRVHRNLDGGGYNLMLHYTLPADRPTGEQQQYTNHLGLCADYRRYVQNSGRSYAAAGWEPYVIVDKVQLRMFLRPPRFVTVKTRDRRSGVVSLKQREEVDTRAFNWVNTIEVMMARADKSTWGGRRISPSTAREFLEYGCGVSLLESKMLSDEEALEMLRGQIDKVQVPPPPEDVKPLPPLSRKDLKHERRLSKEEIRELHRSPSSGVTEWAGVEGQALGVDFWDPRKVESKVGQEWTTVSEIADKVCKYVGLRDHSWVRRALTELKCPDAEKIRGKLPTFWFLSNKGRQFWAAAHREKVARDRQQMAGASTRFGTQRSRR